MNCKSFAVVTTSGSAKVKHVSDKKKDERGEYKEGEHMCLPPLDECNTQGNAISIVCRRGYTTTREIVRSDRKKRKKKRASKGVSTLGREGRNV